MQHQVLSTLNDWRAHARKRWLIMPPLSVEALAWFTRLLGLVIVLNLFDAIMTTFWVGLGEATEANPVMAVLIMESPPLFMIGKLGLACFGVFILEKYRENRLSWAAVIGANLVYVGIALYHVSYLYLRSLA